MATFREKERALLNAMKANNFAVFDGDSEDAYDLIGECLTSFPEYANAVVRMEVLMPVYQERYDGQEFRDHVTQLDNTRRTYHNAACSSIGILNRICEQHGLEPFADIDVNDRYQVADFVGQFVAEIYEDRSAKGMDDLVANRTTREYTANKIRRQLEELGDTIEVNDPETGDPSYGK